MNNPSASHAHDHGHDHGHHNPTGWKRFLYSTNHKDIGTMYLVLAIVSGLIGGFFSLLMRLELQEPGVQYLLTAAGDPDGQLWNVFVSAHGLI
ncbi:MAG: cytochrome c oxidase subunit I, partial [Dongiaceae bacterium]